MVIFKYFFWGRAKVFGGFLGEMSFVLNVLLGGWMVSGWSFTGILNGLLGCPYVSRDFQRDVGHLVELV